MALGKSVTKIDSIENQQKNCLKYKINYAIWIIVSNFIYKLMSLAKISSLNDDRVPE